MDIDNKRAITILENELESALTNIDIYDNQSDVNKAIEYTKALHKAINALQSKIKDRRKAKRFKNKYLKLRNRIVFVKSSLTNGTFYQKYNPKTAEESIDCLYLFINEELKDNI